MTLYAIFDPKPGKADLPVAIAEKFSWRAAILPPVFLVTHRLWLALAAWVVGLFALVMTSAILGGGTSVLLYILSAIWLGLAAPGLRAHALRHRGWRHRADRIAPSADLARLDALS